MLIIPFINMSTSPLRAISTAMRAASSRDSTLTTFQCVAYFFSLSSLITIFEPPTKMMSTNLRSSAHWAAIRDDSSSAHTNAKRQRLLRHSSRASMSLKSFNPSIVFSVYRLCLRFVFLIYIIMCSWKYQLYFFLSFSLANPPSLVSL